MSRRPLQLVLPLFLVIIASVTFGVARADALSFADKVDYATGSHPRGDAVADFDGDGHEDLAVANSWADSVSVLLGYGDGTFAAHVDYGTGSLPYAVAIGDFDGDGHEDLAVANNSAHSVSVLLGYGDGTFAANVDYATGLTPMSVAVADFDGDGHEDLAVANGGANSVSVLLGYGDGTFAAKVDYETGNTPMSVAIGDFDGDGHEDLAVANGWGDSVSVLLGNGDGTFATHADHGTGSHPFAVAVGDFDGDGDKDLVTTDYGASTVSILLGYGDGTFAAKVDYGTGTSPRWLAVADFDGDGHEDLAVANSDADSVSVLLGNGDGTFAAKVDYGTGWIPVSVAVGDFDGDDKRDLVTANAQSSKVSVLLGVWECPWGTIAIEDGALATNGRAVCVSSDVSDSLLMRLRTRGGAWAPWQPYARLSDWVLPSGDGTKTIDVEYSNVLFTTTLSASIVLDTVAPVTTDDAPSGWQTAAPVSVELTGNDGTGSGVAKTEYKLDDAASWTTGTTVPVTGDGTHSVRYRSTDNAGNVEETESCSVQIDTTEPLTKALGVEASWRRFPVALFLAASDATSGVATTEYSTDGGASWDEGAFLIVSAQGETTVSYRSVDAAGNVETVQSSTVRVDTVAPVTSGAKLSVRRGRRATFRIKVADPAPCSTNGARVMIRVRTSKGRSVKTLTFRNVATNKTVSLAWAKCNLKRGTYRYTVYATDAAGNLQRRAGGNRLVVR